MSIREVIYYKVACDREGCTADPDEGSDYSAWSDGEGAEISAVDGADWHKVEEGGRTLHFCTDHPPCSCPEDPCEDCASCAGETCERA